MCIFFAEASYGLHFIFCGCLFLLADLTSKAPALRSSNLVVAPLAASGSSLTWRPWLYIVAPPHRHACDWLTKCTHSVRGNFYLIEWLEWARGTNVYTEIYGIFFFFKNVSSTCQDKEYFFHLQGFSLCLWLLHISSLLHQPWMNCKWDNVERRKDMMFKGGQGREGYLFHSWSSNDCSVFQMAGTVINSNTLDSTIPAASTFVIPSVAFSASLTGQCWQNFSNLRYESKANSLW